MIETKSFQIERQLAMNIYLRVKANKGKERSLLVGLKDQMKRCIKGTDQERVFISMDGVFS